MERLLLRPGEVAEMTGVGKSKCYELIATGEIPSVRIGRSVRVPSDALRRWINELQGSNATDHPARHSATSSAMDLGAKGGKDAE